jgi:hypothetical protein
MIGMARAGNDLLVDFDGDATERKLESLQQIGDGGRRLDLAPLAVNKNANALIHAQMLLTKITVPRLPGAEGPHGSGLRGANGRGGFHPGKGEGDGITAIRIHDIAQ